MEYIKPDDFQVGQFKTILYGRVCPESFIEEFLTGKVYVKRAWEDNSYKGQILQIVAIDLPYVAAKLCAKVHGGYVCHFDIREGWKFKLLSEEYVQAFTGN